MKFQSMVSLFQINGIVILMGLVLGLALLFTVLMPSQMTGLIFLAVLALMIVLLIKDIKKLLLIMFVVDIPLGFDIALANSGKNLGGPAGFLISLMTIALVIGYVRWLVIKPTDTRVHIGNNIILPTVIFLFITLVSAFQAKDIWFTVTQTFLTLQFVLMYFYLINHINNWNDVSLIVTTLAVCVFLESILMLMQFYGNLQFSVLSVGLEDVAGRAAGTFSGPNVAASFLAPAIAIIFAAYLTDNRLVNNKLALIAMILGLIALFITKSRSGWIGIFLELLIITWQALRNRIVTKAIWYLSGIVLILGVGFSSLIADRALDNQSAVSRLWYDRLALNVIQEHMFTGIGANNQQFLWENQDYLPLELVGRPDREIHNAYLAIWVELGLFGFLTFLWMLISAGWIGFTASLRTTNRYISIAITGFLSALIYFMFHMGVATFTGRRLEFLWVIFALITVTSMLANQKSDMDRLGEN